MLTKSLCRFKRPLVQTSNTFRRKFAHNVRGYPNFSLRQSVSQLKQKNQFDENNDGKSSRNWSSVALSRDEPTIEKSIEQQYSKKTPLEHVLLRPGMYVGPVERLPPNDVWVPEPLPQPYIMFSSQQETNKKVEEISYRMVHKEYGLVPALIKVFDEILVNASDNRLRNPKSCTMLDVRIDPGAPGRDPCIRVWNNGKGIPVQVRLLYKCRGKSFL